MQKQNSQRKAKLSENRDGNLAEYQTLRSELLNTQGQRLQIISLTVGAFGGLLAISAGYILNVEDTTSSTQVIVSIGGAIALSRLYPF